MVYTQFELKKEFYKIPNCIRYDVPKRCDFFLSFLLNPIFKTGALRENEIVVATIFLTTGTSFIR